MELRAAHDRWIDEREARVWGEWGLATLSATHWLTAEPVAIDGLPGRWSVVDGEVRGDGVRLAPGEQLETEGVLLRAFSRDGSHLFAVPHTGRGVRWDVRAESWKRHACLVAGRELTEAEWRDALPDRPLRPVCRRR